jgi:putative RNA 2'-phosphotransferase
MDKKLKATSKRISYVLRHDPADAGLTLDENGWASVALLLIDLRVDMATLEKIVADNEKKRFAFNDDNTKIRAVQGHSVDVDLGLVAKEPPSVLYHGTSRDTMKYIVRQGILPMSRQHVHLSADRDTAKSVGGRHGKPYVIEIWTQVMVEAGHKFYLSENGVWLTESVPTNFLYISEEDMREFQKFHLAD